LKIYQKPTKTTRGKTYFPKTRCTMGGTTQPSPRLLAKRMGFVFTCGKKKNCPKGGTTTGHNQESPPQTIREEGNDPAPQAFVPTRKRAGVSQQHPSPQKKKLAWVGGFLHLLLIKGQVFTGCGGDQGTGNGKNPHRGVQNMEQEKPPPHFNPTHNATPCHLF